MTTNVKISTNYVHPGKSLRVQVVDPKNGTLYRSLAVDQQKVNDHGGNYECETLYVHDGSKILVEEVDGVVAHPASEVPETVAAAVPDRVAERDNAFQQKVDRALAGTETVEDEIQRKGLTAQRITPADIEAAVLAAQYWQPLGTTLTVCALTLQNGTTVTGESACASPENFDAELGQRIAREDAKRKIWALEGYLLRERLSLVHRKAA